MLAINTPRILHRIDFLGPIVDWLEGILKDGIEANLNHLFDSVNSQISWATTELGKTPQGYNSSVFNLIRTLSEQVILPIAGLLIAFVCTYELIQLLTERNNMHDFDIAILFKWGFKTACTISIVSNTWNIVMAVFDVAQHVVHSASSSISGLVGGGGIETATVVDSIMSDLPSGTGELIGLLLISFLARIVVIGIYVYLYIIVVGRMIEIYLTTSLAPIPMATILSRDGAHSMGRNYLRNLFALAFQAFMIMVCLAVFSLLVTDPHLYTSGTSLTMMINVIAIVVLLAFTVGKTGSFAKSIFGAH